MGRLLDIMTQLECEDPLIKQACENEARAFKSKQIQELGKKFCLQYGETEDNYSQWWIDDLLEHKDWDEVIDYLRNHVE